MPEEDYADLLFRDQDGDMPADYEAVRRQRAAKQLSDVIRMAPAPTHACLPPRLGHLH